MTPSPERDALRAAVLAAPDDDLPRLVYADWLDETGDADGARFVRSQVALAALPEWEPQAVALRRTQPEWDLSQAWVHELPRLSSDRGVHWNPGKPFRRGFGYSLQAPILRALQFELPSLLTEVPIERLGLYAATLDQWQDFARSPWLRRIREIAFEGIGAPIEAMRELYGAPGVAGLRAIDFRSSTSAAMPEVLSRLWRSPLGDRLEKLELAQAFGADESWFEDFLEAFQVGGERLRSLKLQSMGFGSAHLSRFLTARAWTNLEELAIADEGGPAGADYLGYPDCWPALRTLRFEGVNVHFASPHQLANSLRPPNLTVLDLANSPLHPEAVQALAKSDHLAKLRVVRLRRMRIDNRGVRYLAHAQFWKNLVELDLRDNPIDENGVKHLLKRQPPPELELLRLDRNFPDAVTEELQVRFADKVVLEEVEGRG